MLNCFKDAEWPTKCSVKKDIDSEIVENQNMKVYAHLVNDFE